MIQTKKNKFNKVFFLLLFFAIFCFAKPLDIKAQSTDAIAVRVVENPLHYSSLRWYQAQNFAGSPQVLSIDGYEAVRNGRTVYVDVANIIDKNNDGIPDYLYTNIFIISYNQDIQGTTLDVFGQMLKNFKFNTNLTDSGVCNKTTTAACLNDANCPPSEYCNSKKAKTIRDVKRLADLEEISLSLDRYKQINKNFPMIKAGTYLANKTLSVWPSWQQTLGRELGASLPLDPLNQLGNCPGYDPVTCWDEKNKKFVTDLTKAELPPSSHVYMYQGDDLGKTAKYCAQMESSYDNMIAINCFRDRKVNNAPVINGANLVGKYGEEFIGYVGVSDLDGDPLKLTVDLISPADAGTWASRKWQWDSGLNKFSTISSLSSGQFIIHAVKTGKVGTLGYYKVKLTLDDGQGETNSVVSKIYDLTVEPSTLSLEKAQKTVIIGSPDSISMIGSDANQDPFTSLEFRSATYNNTLLDRDTLKNNGFILNGMSLAEEFKPAQHTGVYVVNVAASDPTLPMNWVNSNFTYVIKNNPPVFKNLTATFSNNTTKTCSPNDTCVVLIDNGEAATVKIEGTDPDGHTLTYSLVDDYSGQLIINSSSGVISGFEKLKFDSLTNKTFDDKIYNISVKIKDQYCNNSSAEECSNIYSFNLSVKPYCSADYPESASHSTFRETYTVNKSGDMINTGQSLNDCSVITSASADVKFIGNPHNQAIILVSDLSQSMEANITINGVAESAISRLRNALTATTTGFFDQIYNIAKDYNTENYINIGLVAYNSVIKDFLSLQNLSYPSTVNDLKDRVNTYVIDYETNTLLGLNKAEELLSPVVDKNTEKIVVLMSDGIPVIDGVKETLQCWTPALPSCDCGGTWPDNCNDVPPCDEEGQSRVAVYKYDVITSCKCYTPDLFCDCGKKDATTCNPYPTCSPTEDPYTESYFKTWGEECGCRKITCDNRCDTIHYISGQSPSCYGAKTDCEYGLDVNTCGCKPNDFHSVYNNLFQKYFGFFDIFKSHPAIAATIQTQCRGSIPSCAGQTCPAGQVSYNCYSEKIINCPITSDVDKQAQALKDSGAFLYTIYYNTGGSSTEDPAKTMCRWSSTIKEGGNCVDGTYAFSGNDIDSMIKKVLSRIVTKPKDVQIGTFTIEDSAPSLIVSQTNTAIDGLTCGAINPVVKYKNTGYLEFSNLTINYCRAKLHP